MNDDLIREWLQDPQAVKDKLSLGSTSQIYIDNLLKQLQILWYSKELADPRIAQTVERKILPMFQILADEMEKMVNEYQSKYGEI